MIWPDSCVATWRFPKIAPNDPSHWTRILFYRNNHGDFSVVSKKPQYANMVIFYDYMVIFYQYMTIWYYFL